MVSITPSESIDLDLVVEPPEVVELPLRGADDPVSGAVVKLGRAGWDDEGCCGSGRVLEVAERDLWSGDEQLSLVPVGHLAKLLVGDSRLHPRKGVPIGTRPLRETAGDVASSHRYAVQAIVASVGP